MSSPPFGIQKGFSKNDIKVGGELRPFIYEIPAVPNPHSDFPLVYAQITPLHGVSCVTAQTKLILPAVLFGLDIYILFEKLINQLSKKYKKPTSKIDNLKSRAEFIKEYNHQVKPYEDIKCYAEWDFRNTQRKRNAISLPNDLIYIELSYRPNVYFDDQNYYFYLTYLYNNYELARQEIRNMDDNALREKNNMDENAL